MAAMELSKSFVELVGSPVNLGKTTLGIQTAIELSFAQDGSTITQSEVKRRFRVCENIFKQLRGDMKWGIDRIIDHLPRYLRAELDGDAWEPDQRRCWISRDG